MNTERVKRFTLTKRVISILSLVCHLFAYLQIILKTGLANFPEPWNYQYLILLSISLLLSVSFIIFSNDYFFIIILAMKFFILVIIGYPMGDYLGIKLSLITSLILDATFNLSFPKNEVISISAAVLYLLTRRFMEIDPISGYDLLSLLLYCSILVTVCNLVQRQKGWLDELRASSRQKDNAIDQLIASNTGFQQYANIVEKQTQINERNQMTREIHDTIGHALSNIMMMIKAAIALSKKCPAKLLNLLSQTQEQADLAYKEMRHVLHLFRSIDESEIFGVKEFRKIAEIFEKATGIHVEIEYGNIPWTFGRLIDLTLFRFIQEGLTNAHKHGKATLIKIYLWVDDFDILVTIHDNGSGAGTVHEGIGFLGMKERISLLDGDLYYKNVVDGFQISARIPVKQAEIR